MLRQEMQEEIDTLIAQYPAESKAQIKVRVASWLDGFDLSNAAYTQAEQKDRILSDLVTYSGMEED